MFSSRAENVADWVMYRNARAAAAEARGWPVHWYDAKSVLGAASQVLSVENSRHANGDTEETRHHRDVVQAKAACFSGGGQGASHDAPR